MSKFKLGDAVVVDGRPGTVVGFRPSIGSLQGSLQGPLQPGAPDQEGSFLEIDFGGADHNSLYPENEVAPAKPAAR